MNPYELERLAKQHLQLPRGRLQEADGRVHGTAQPRTKAAGRRFTAVTELVKRVERLAENEADPLDAIAARIKEAIGGDTDPCLLMGLLLEGIAQTVVQTSLRVDF